VDGEQYRRLLSAIYGCVNELRVYHMRGGGETTIPRFNETARSLFPAMAAEPEAALGVAEAMMMLRRRLERAVRRAGEERAAQPAPGERRRRWPFRR
jgi:hypothetical protein